MQALPKRSLGNPERELPGQFISPDIRGRLFILRRNRQGNFVAGGIACGEGGGGGGYNGGVITVLLVRYLKRQRGTPELVLTASKCCCRTAGPQYLATHPSQRCLTPAPVTAGPASLVRAGPGVLTSAGGPPQSSTGNVKPVPCLLRGSSTTLKVH